MSRVSRRAVTLAGLLVALAACGPVRMEPQMALPPPLIDRMPVAVAVHYPQEFREFRHQEKRQGVEYDALLGPGHVAKFKALLEAMFERVVDIPDPAGAAELVPPVSFVIQPYFEDYAFLTPSDLAGDAYTVTIRYRVEVYEPSGQRVDAYVFTGYGREKKGNFTGTEPLLKATQRAMRDAGAKFAIEFPEQASVRRLLDRGGMEALPVGAQSAGDSLGGFGGSPPVEPSPATESSPAAEPPASAEESSPPAP